MLSSLFPEKLSSQPRTAFCFAQISKAVFVFFEQVGIFSFHFGETCGIMGIKDRLIYLKCKNRKDEFL